MTTSGIHESPQLGMALETFATEAVLSLRPLFEQVAAPGDFTFPDWVMLYALAQQYRPDLVVEVGRGYGNSTCVFLQVAAILRCRFVTFDLYGEGWKITGPKVLAIKGSEWTKGATFVDEPFEQCDLELVLPEQRGRTLLFWDAHGKELAEFMVNRVFPRLRSRSNLVIIHDISDVRGGLIGLNPDYLVTESFQSPFEELLTLDAFWKSEGIEVKSPPLDVDTMRHHAPERWTSMVLGLPGDLQQLVGKGGHWVYFQLPPLRKLSGLHSVLSDV